MPTEFTPLSALIGGALIGVAATLLYALLGRIAGVSGILNSALEQRSERGWRVAFLFGLIIAAGAWFAIADVAPPSRLARPGFVWWLVLAGLLVGFGTRSGSGCTSGHGICGLSRLSKRSLVAVATFMGAGFVTVYVLRHLMGGLA